MRHYNAVKVSLVVICTNDILSNFAVQVGVDLYLRTVHILVLILFLILKMYLRPSAWTCQSVSVGRIGE